MGNERVHPGTTADATAEEHGRLPSRRPRRPNGHGHRTAEGLSKRLPPRRTADPDRDDLQDIAAMIEFLRTEAPGKPEGPDEA